MNRGVIGWQSRNYVNNPEKGKDWWSNILTLRNRLSVGVLRGPFLISGGNMYAVMHELHGERYMENRHGLFWLRPYLPKTLTDSHWMRIGWSGEDIWLRRLREILFHPDTKSWEVDV